LLSASLRRFLGSCLERYWFSAKAYIEANLGDVSLDPPQVAIAVDVSLRRLRELFQERGQRISEYIWRRRLETAARLVTDPWCVHLQIGIVAYGTGFATQAHFSRRFKYQYGPRPRDYRHRALLQSAAIGHAGIG
jgi:AraC family transcriptional regulator, positive regulator of tynA and feaB